MSVNIKAENEEKFYKAYGQLNENQRAAVDQIYEPLMAIAGPGTGKTQLLALRVCNILMQADIAPHNILCITYTDAGSHAMQKRLAEFLSSDAYGVGIYTYHAFCNKIIQENPEYFGSYRNLQLAEDLERQEIIMEIIDNLPLDHNLKRITGDVYYDTKGILGIFEAMKKEDWSPEYAAKKCEEYIESLPHREEFQYKRPPKGGKPGDPKIKDIQKETDKIEKFKAAALLYDEYNAAMKKRELMDYSDMILWVIAAFREHPDLLYRYQEQYQFILADEYQDTNGAQNEILNYLCDYEKPNIFVVGDDDQSIFRFQGANVQNISDFINKYNPGVITLVNNYRSHRAILEAATMLISNNQERLSTQFGVSKTLIESRKNKPNGGKPQILVYKNRDSEYAGVGNRILELIAQGVKESEIAVIYKKHKTADPLIQFLRAKNIPVHMQKSINILKDAHIKNLILLMGYIQGEFENTGSKDADLFKILHFSFFKLNALDVARIAYYISTKNTLDSSSQLSFREAIASEKILSEAGVSHPSSFVKVANFLGEAISNISNFTVQVFFQKLISESGFLSEIMSSGDVKLGLESLNCLFDYIKHKTARKDQYTLADILGDFEKMEKFGLSLHLRIVYNSAQGVNFMSMHGSKGLEFKHVFMIDCTDQSLQNKSRNSFKYPDNLVRSTDAPKELELEENRRLFFVGMTRAEDFLYISYAGRDDKDKDMAPIRFIYEAGLEVDEERDLEELSDEKINEFLLIKLRNEKVDWDLFDASMIDVWKEDFVFSPTTLNKYLNCKLSFYFETVLRVPGARTAMMGYGKAIHYALEYFFNQHKKEITSGKLLEVEQLIAYFSKGMLKFSSHFTSHEKLEYQYLGEQVLRNYYEENQAIWVMAKDYIMEARLKTMVEDMPIKGVLDQITIHSDFMDITDFKTGKYRSESVKTGGDYWRQAVCYAILADSFPGKIPSMGSVSMHYLSIGSERSKISFKVMDEDRKLVIDDLRNSYEGIKRREFSPGCGDERCQWCNFVKTQNPDLLMALSGKEEWEAEA
jgi:DNA helicase II / ATP-dependent DNA helicase PcrA